MKKTDELISDFSYKQKKFGYLQSINLHRIFDEDSCSEYSLNIILCDYPFYDGDQKLLLTFFGVRNFKIGDLDGMFKLFVNITDISENQIEKIHYKVKEEENELFSFCCETFRFEMI